MADVDTRELTLREQVAQLEKLTRYVMEAQDQLRRMLERVLREVSADGPDTG